MKILIENEIQKIKFIDFYKLIQKGGKYQCSTPDGWKDIGDIYLKKNKQKYKTKFLSGDEIITSGDHLFEIETTDLGEDHEIFDRIEILDNGFWIRAKNLKEGDPTISKNGIDFVSSTKFIEIGDTYDLEILSENHKYWSDKISSHNTGKSAIAEGLAQRIIQRKCSRTLFNKRIIILDLSLMVAGTKYRGQFEERVKALMAELEKNPDIILFIDEIHTIIGAGGASGSLDASNMFKPALARGEIQIIGATTLDEYRKHIEKDGALERRFQKIIVEPATAEDTLQILNNIKHKYESYHNVKYTDEAIKACVYLTNRYMSDRHLPDKAIDALDEAGSRVHISNIVVPKEITDLEQKISEIKDKKSEVVRSQRYEEAAKLRDTEKTFQKQLEESREKWDAESRENKQTVDEENIAEVVSMMSGVPLNKISENENAKLAKMYDVLTSKIIGQDNAVKSIVKAIQRGRIGMKDENKPIFSGILIGKSGVGKSELAKQLAKYLFDSEDALIRFDMSEYMEKFSSSRMQGASPGYVGYDDTNALDIIRRKPYSVILFDEIEKAHPDIFNLFLQMLDEGQIVDTQGRKISFKNSVILMTSNVGTKSVMDFGSGIGFSTKTKIENKDANIKAVLEKELRKKFPPEFINRLDDIIYFNDLSKEDILKIVDLELNKTLEKVKTIGFKLTVSNDLKTHISEIGFDPLFGARPLKRTIQKWIDDVLTEYIMSNNPKKGINMIIDYNKEKNESFIIDSESRKKKKENNIEK